MKFPYIVMHRLHSLFLKNQVVDSTPLQSDFIAISRNVENGSPSWHIFSQHYGIEETLPGEDFAVLLEYIKSIDDRKIVAASISDLKDAKHIGGYLWLELDIVPILTESGSLREQAEEISKHFSGYGHNGRLIKIDELCNEVIVPFLVNKDAYQSTVDPDEWTSFIKLCEEFKGKRIAYFSATPQGGGVALMRHSLMRIFHECQVDGHWFILKNNAEAFLITKGKIHNVLQGVAPKEVDFTDKDKDILENWYKEHIEMFTNEWLKDDVIVIDDPQPAGLIPYIKKINPKAKIIYRSHIQIETELIKDESSVQHKVWEYLWENIQYADCFISHPILNFVPDTVSKEKLLFMPPSTDKIDGLNKHLFPPQIKYYHSWFNLLLKGEGQTPLDLARGYIVQIARFDPSKGIEDVLDVYKTLCEKFNAEKKIPPQLVISGHGSIDDPDGAIIYEKILGILDTQDFANIKTDIKILRLPSNDQLLNMLMQQCIICLQLSHKEGYEVKVTESLMKGRVAIVYNSGGLSLQIKNGIDGFIVDTGDIKSVTDHIYELLTDRAKYELMSIQAESSYERKTGAVILASNWMMIANSLLNSNNGVETISSFFSHPQISSVR